jgi:hypothetical protein
MEFSASLGKTAKISTIGIVSLFVAIMAGMFVSGSDNLFPTAIILPMTLVFVLGLSYYFSIKSYEVTDDEIIIRRPFDRVSYKKASVKSAERIEGKSIRFAVRTFGVGGLFAYTGEFWNSKYGSMTWYVTRMDTAIMMTTSSNKKIVISPDRPEEFTSALTR